MLFSSRFGTNAALFFVHGKSNRKRNSSLRMKTVHQQNLHTTWLYDGEPEYVDLNVEAALLEQGGYVVVLELTNGKLRLAATRHPAKYVKGWRHNVRRYGALDIVRVLVSRPYLRYEAAKRLLATKLAEYKDDESDAYRLDVETFKEKVKELTPLLQKVQISP